MVTYHMLLGTYHIDNRWSEGAWNIAPSTSITLVLPIIKHQPFLIFQNLFFYFNLFIRANHYFLVSPYQINKYTSRCSNMFVRINKFSQGVHLKMNLKIWRWIWIFYSLSMTIISWLIWNLGKFTKPHRMR